MVCIVRLTHVPIVRYQVVDYKALAGDASDTLPGVRGVGDKTAIALLERFGTLEGIYNNLEVNNPVLWGL